MNDDNAVVMGVLEPILVFQRTAVAWEDIMNFVHVFGASTAAFLILGNGAAIAGETINDVGAIACVSHANNRDVR